MPASGPPGCYREENLMITRAVAAICLVLVLSAAVSAQIFDAVLDGLQESPPVATPGNGVGTAVYNAGTDTLNVSVTFSDLIGNTTDSHIHCCFTDPPSRNIGVAVGFTPHGFPIGVTSGVFNANIDLSNAANYTSSFINTFGGGTVTGARNALLAGMTNSTAYFNIHTNFRPGGEIRGDISRIPEPTSLLLLFSGLAAIGCGRRLR
jgi:opacity protein-like surface antigen